SGKRAPGGIAADRNPVGVDTDMRRVGADPSERCERVVDGRGIFVLRRETIVDGDNAKSAFVRHDAAQAVMGLDVADHEPAAVIVDQRRHRIAPGGDRRVDADGNGPPGPGTVRFSVLPTGTSFGPTSCIRPTKISRAATGPASDILGPGTAAI